MLLKKKGSKSSYKLMHKKGKRQPAKESTAVEKERCLLEAPKFAVAEGVVALLMRM
jgi:hypothetical protein